MNHAFEYETTDDLLRRSNSQFLRTHFHWKAKLASVAYALIAVLLVVTDPGVLSGIMAGFGILLFGLVGFAFATRLRRARAFMRKLPHRRAKCTIDDTGLHLENAAGISHLEWRMVEKAVAGPHVWHFYISRNVPFAVPAAALADGAADFVTDKIQSAGGKIVRIA